jgi:hypothetical protein
MAKGGGAEGAVVTYPAPHGTDAVTLSEGESAQFGRGAECKIRFGYAPIPDDTVPRVAGSLLAANQRVFIESTGLLGHRTLEVRTPSGTTRIPAGEAFSPRERHFDVVVLGEQSSWRLGVRVCATERTAPEQISTDPPTRRFSLDLNEREFAVLTAYCEPPNRSRSEPATHKEVAAALNYHPNTVREILYEIWAQMLELQIPMPDVSDKRIAVVEATRLHGLLWYQK